LFTLVAGTADNRGEDGAGRIVTGETGLAHAGAVVNHKGGNILVAHFRGLIVGKLQ